MTTNSSQRVASFATEAAGVAEEAPSVIQLEDISHSYGQERPALDHVSFDVRFAEIFGLLGPNGSGKTTLFRILSTLMLPASGCAIIMGSDARSKPAALRRRIGVVVRDQEQVTILVTTHLMEEAERCDRLAVLNLGKLVALGTPAELKHEIGGDVILLDTRDPESLAHRLRERFTVEAAVISGKVRLERENGHRFVTEVVEAFPGEIDSVSVSKPTLEDVFIHRTGHRFWTDANPERAG